MGFWKSSIVIGVVWGIWHAPMILQGHNYPDRRIFGVLMMIIFCLLLSPILGYITLKAKSVLAASICHGTIKSEQTRRRQLDEEKTSQIKAYQYSPL